MPIEFSVWWIVALNCVGWPVIQIGLAWLFTRMPGRWFHPPGELAVEGWLYRQIFRVQRWKDRLPDAAGWFAGGFAKRSLASSESRYLQNFIRETWRGELCHWCALAFTLVFFLWNPWWADIVILAYATAANLPCILTQRYNRLRLRRLLNRITATCHKFGNDKPADACFTCPDDHSG